MTPTGPKAPKSRKGKGRQGGPGNYAGANYQTLVGVYETVQLLNSLAVHPWETMKLAIEARIQGADGQVGYDLALPESARRLEIKKSPTRTDVDEFVSAIAADPDSLDGNTTFEFVHSRGGQAVVDLEVIAALAREALDDADFERRASCLTPSQRELASILGTEPRRRARQIRTSYLPLEHAQKSIEFLTDRAYRNGLAQSVRDRLANRIEKAAENREVLHVVTLRDELASLGGGTRLNPLPDLTGLSRDLQDALAILSTLRSPLPLAVLAMAVNADAATLSIELHPFVISTMIETRPAVMLAFRLEAIVRPDTRVLLASTLRSLLAIAEDRDQRVLAVSQVTNIARLAEHLMHDEPELVAGSYHRAEKLFKTRGNLFLALRASRVALDASERIPGGRTKVTDEQLRSRAQTKICGESWVLQRIGELDDAERVAEESLQLGEVLGWARNTAYCSKCLGRLQRIRAERTTDPTERAQRLAKSESLLRTAVQQFSASAEFGPDHPEVGDCHSLLARTLYVAGRRSEARDELLDAQDRLAGIRGEKDWADAQLLKAEMLAADNELDAARATIDDVFVRFPPSDDTDATEITARSLALRGRIWLRKDRVTAAVDFGHAADLYEVLEDPGRADEQRWAQIEAERRVPAVLSELIHGESVAVRVAAVLAFEAELSESGRRAASQRQGLPVARARQIVANARLDAARRERRWR